MDKELQQALAAIISKATQAAEAGAAFLSAELPEVVRQLLMWKATEAGVWAALQLALVVGVYCAYRRIRTWLIAENEWEGGGMIFALVTALIVGLPFFFAAMYNLVDVLQILIAPKIYLIEYAASLAQGAAK